MENFQSHEDTGKIPPQIDPKAGVLKTDDFNYAGGIRQEQVYGADDILLNANFRVPPVQKASHFDTLNQQVANGGGTPFLDSDMVQVPDLGDSPEVRIEKDQKVLELLLAKHAEAENMGNTAEMAKISAQIALLTSRMKPN